MRDLAQVKAQIIGGHLPSLLFFRLESKVSTNTLFRYFFAGEPKLQPRRGTEKMRLHLEIKTELHFLECDVFFKDNREYLDSGNSKIVQRQNILPL